MSKTVVIQGASRGIGREFVRQLAAREDVGKVFATCREPEGFEAPEEATAGDSKIVIIPLDAEDEATIAAAARQIGEQTAVVDVLINCAGVLHTPGGMEPERRLDDLDPTWLQKSFAVNAAGPALVVKHFRKLLQRSESPVVASLSARVSSIADNRLGGWYGYRASKAAQNMMTRCMAIELGRGANKVTVIGLHPGTVDTDLSRPFQGNVPEGKLFSKSRAVRQLLAIIDRAELKDSGKLFAWDGSEIPW